MWFLEIVGDISGVLDCEAGKVLHEQLADP